MSLTSPTGKPPITVLLVDDSAVALALLARVLATSPEIKVVGTARSGREALEMIPRLQPAVVCTDLHMPDIDGLELTRQVVSLYPRPVLVISSAAREDGRNNVFRLLEAGALDVLPKPAGSSPEDYDRMARELISKIKILAGVYVFRRRAVDATAPLQEPPGAVLAAASSRPQIVVVGASTGGPQALRCIFSNLPGDFPLPVICVQHITSGFLPGLIDWLRNQSPLNIRIAVAGELPKAGTIYLPPEDRHLEIGSDGRFVATTRDSINGHRPSVTVSMTSAVGYFGGGVVGVLLSGMGRDGADGMLAIARAGGVTIAQDERSSTVFGMPKQAIELGAARYILNPEEIARQLLQIVRDAARDESQST